MNLVPDPDAVDRLVGKLEGRTIVGAGVDKNGDGFHVFLDDGVVFVCIGVVGVYNPEPPTLQ